MYRQGDVAIIPMDLFKETFPETSTEKETQVKRDKGRVVLAYGEVTGHAHAIADPHVEMWTMLGAKDNAAPGNDNDRILHCLDEVQLDHEEHETIKLPAGLYVVRRQREYGPEELRTVAD